jgi:hypothetical protein
MRHSHTSRGLRTSSKSILALVALGFAGACSDSMSAPTSEVSVKVPAAYTEVTGVTSFKYSSRKGVTVRLGDHVLVIPAGGICDPATSSYGPGTWDDDCAPLTHSLIITATTYADADGHPYVDFQPALRFVPTKETDLYLKDGKRTTAGIVTINYCNALAVCVDESLTDPSLVTQRVGSSRLVFRRVKHFSGYNVVTGDYCPGTVVDDGSGGLWCDTSGSDQTRSGYMVASGLSQTNGDGTAVRRRKSKIQ